MDERESSELEAVCRSTDEARGLPNRHYVSRRTFEHERRALWLRHWTGIGFGKDVPEPGDVYPLDFLGMPLLLVREESGAVAVFQNTCRHRGMILVDAPTRVRKVIRCPYHSWCYRLDGSLRATPHVGGPGCNVHESIRPAELGLFRIRSAVWRDVIFVDLSGTAEPFDAFLSSLRGRWSEFDQPLHHGGTNSTIELDVRCNWKLAVENYCESYHLPWIHPGLNSYSRLQDHYDILDTEAGRFAGQGTRVYRRLTTDDGSVLPEFASLSSHWDQAAEYVALFPNVLLGVHRDHAFAIVLMPSDVDRTRERIELYYSEAGASDPGLADLRARNARLWQTVFGEDVGVVEGMQRGRHGDRFDGGRFSAAMDRATHAFHAWVARRMLRAAPGTDVAAAARHEIAGAAPGDTPLDGTVLAGAASSDPLARG